MKAPRWQAAAAAALLAALLAASAAGCGTKSPGASHTSESARGAHIVAQAARISCPFLIRVQAPPAGVTPRVTQHIPRGFTPVMAVQCVRSVIRVKGRGLWWADIKREATSGLGPLMTALRKPSSHSNPPTAVCPMIAFPLPWFELVGANGQVIRPVIPRQPCGLASTAVMRALDKLRWRTVSRTLVAKFKVLEPLSGAG